MNKEDEYRLFNQLVSCMNMMSNYLALIELRHGEIIYKLNQLLKLEKDIMADLTALNTEVSAETDLVTAVQAMVTGLNSSVADLQAQLAALQNQPQTDQAAIDAITAQLAQSNAALRAVTAVATNTPAA